MLFFSKSRSFPTFRKRLLAWYDANRRPLPWRKDRDAYRVWVSEIMLQQTRVAAVIDYYGRFLAAFPTVDKLAAASEPKVLAQWSGLGYYRRARMMHAAARKLVAEHRGRFPQTSAALRELPGIGRYTAAAVASISFEEPVAVVDGNVERVLQRLAGDRARSLDHWSAAQQLLDTERPGDFNQAMMELGATVCLPKNPLCTKCPVRSGCMTRGEHNAPMSKRQGKAILHHVLASDGEHVALVQRSKKARLMPGMWELPSGVSSRKPFLTVRHSITNTRYTVHVSRAKAAKGSIQLSLNRAAKLPLTGLTRKILRRLELLKD